MPQQVMVDVEQAVDRLVLWNNGGEVLDRGIKIEQQLALAVLAHHAFDPEKRRQAHAASDRLDAVQARARVENEVAGREFDPVSAEGVGDHQLAALIIVRRAEKKSGGEVG